MRLIAVSLMPLMFARSRLRQPSFLATSTKAAPNLDIMSSLNRATRSSFRSLVIGLQLSFRSDFGALDMALNRDPVRRTWHWKGCLGSSLEPNFPESCRPGRCLHSVSVLDGYQVS